MPHDARAEVDSVCACAPALYTALLGAAQRPGPGGSVPTLMDMACVLGGALAEIALADEAPDVALQGALTRLARDVGCAPAAGAVPPGVLPPAHGVDAATEDGRAAARAVWEDGPDDPRAFEASARAVAADLIAAWEGGAALPRARALRVVVELARRALAFEFAAQELCDAVIERRLAPGLWSPGEGITALAAAAGRRQALGLGGAYVQGPAGPPAARPPPVWALPMPGALDALARVMTREAVRGGVEAGTDWRLGLAANDMPLSAPVELIRGVEPMCQGFFRAIALPSWREQAVACAKAAGRMLAVAAGGALPDIEPAIAKPLAMAALAETYRYVSHTRASLVG
jgi:hypothetical protein